MMMTTLGALVRVVVTSLQVEEEAHLQKIVAVVLPSWAADVESWPERRRGLLHGQGSGTGLRCTVAIESSTG